MSYNSGNARRIFYTKWNKLREEYRAAGMEEDAIQKLYEYDLAVFNNDRAHHRYDVEIPTADDSENQSDYVEYERATTVTDTYHETKTRFAWVGEIKNERLQAGLEKLSDEELQLITLYFYEEYSTVELSKVYGITHQNISKRIIKITNFLKNFDFQGAE
ncbi:sigma factor-like helix-turn-helix DNA-binding protein [Faecalibacterium prausnitzii]|uniref:Sigma-70, region 4 n=1 Tax=Faecalibacterium prausnitzii TaxID=853 RepID=A0A564TEG4_9FIRM|nr:sigma factor-like helix-turn-helix DNA-binding protein [Faecalibacterium prausnitzii]VUX05838.1 Sigma-70, region 4 [Faecalibacterium prausnitzii]